MANLTINKITFEEHSTNGIINISYGNVNCDLHINEKLEFSIPEKLQVLVDAGVIVSFENVKDEYKSKLKNREEILKQQRVEKYSKLYHSSYIHSIELPAIDGVTFKKESKEDYILRMLDNTPWDKSVKGITVFYKNYNEIIDRVDTSSRSYYKDFKFQLCSSITNYKKRNYKKLETAINKFVELVDNDIEATLNKQIKESNNKKEIEYMLTFLSSNFEYNIEHKNEYVSSRYSDGYYIDRYYLIKGERKIKIYFFKRDNKFALGSFKNLTLEQAIKIIEIL